jgi:hypothetical protein
MQKNLNRQYFIIVLLLSLAIGVTMRFPMVMSYIFGEADTGRGNILKEEMEGSPVGQRRTGVMRKGTGSVTTREKGRDTTGRNRENSPTA